MGIKIGVDVGGTNTDAVLLVNGKLRASKKSITTANITLGITNAINSVLQESQIPAEKVQSINIGTTHLVNAFIQGEGLSRVMALRLAGESTTALPPGSGWPMEVRERLIGKECFIADGGYEYDGKKISPIKPEQIEWAIHHAITEKIHSVAVTGVFANVNSKQEEEVKARFHAADPSIKVTVSHEMGGLGLLNRENATIINAAALDLYTKISKAIRDVVDRLHISAQVYLTYGDGTKTNLGDLHSTPLKTLYSGPVNSILGTASLINFEEAVTVDIGGTSSDIGLLQGGNPVYENSSFPITGLGVPCNFTLPRLHSFGLGGGSIISYVDTNNIQVGPESVGYALSSRAFVFGGDTLTPTDIAVALGRLKIGVLDQTALKEKIAYCTKSKCVEDLLERIDEKLHILLSNGIKQALASIEKVPSNLVLVGGGAVVFDTHRLQKLMTKQFSSILVPEFGTVANALGAAKSKIGAKFVKVYDYAKVPRNIVLAEATKRAVEAAIQKGAFPETVKTSSITETQINYLNGQPHEITVCVAGEDQGGGHVASSIPSSIPVKVYKATDQLESLSSTTQIAQKNNASALMDDFQTLSETDIGDIAIGSSFLGSGGGGSPALGYQLALNALAKGKKIRILPLPDLPNDALVAVFGAMGSPVVGDERPPSFLEGVKAIEEFLVQDKKFEGEVTR